MEQAVSQMSKTVDESEKAGKQSRADTSVLVEDLRSEFKALKGNLDEIKYDLKEVKDSQKKFQEDVDVRLKDLEGKPTSQGSPSTNVKTVGSEDQQYKKALRTVLDQRDYDKAIVEFSSFLNVYPSSSYAGNAQYWLAESYYKKGDAPSAISEYQKLVDKFPKSEKVCDAIYKQGLAFTDLKDLEKSKLFFTEAKSRCPKSVTASKAKQKLMELAGTKPKK
jgi:tol-pal system protein YbgF